MTTLRRRLCIIGPHGCGKTCLRYSFLGQKFKEDMLRITVACQALPAQFPTGTSDNEIKVFIDDTSGEERFRNAVTRTFVRHAKCVLLCFDLSDKRSFQQVQHLWFPWMRDECACEAKVILVGMKADLKAEVDRKAVVKWASENGIEDYFKTSSKTGIGVIKLAEYIGSHFASLQLLLYEGTVFSLDEEKDSEKGPRFGLCMKCC